MLRLTGARQVVILTREDHELGIHAVMPERAKPLLALFDRHAVIVVGMQNQRRRLDVPGVLERRSAPVLVEIVEQKTIEVVLVAVSAIPSPVIADEIGNAAQRDRGLESIGVPENPVGHEAAVTSAGDAEPVLIDPLILLQRRVDAGHDILIVHAAPVVDNAALKLLPVAG